MGISALVPALHRSVKRASLAGAVICAGLALAAPALAAGDTVRAYFFGNSLVLHQSDSAETTVPYWLAQMAGQSRRRFAMDGQWGFLRNFERDFPPLSTWSVRGVKGVWSRDAGDFTRAGFTDIVITPANFIQYQPADAAYDGENTDAASPLSATLGLLDQLSPEVPVFIYEGWAAMDGIARAFPPSKAEIADFHQYNLGAYHDWYGDYIARLKDARPARDIRLIPVAQVLSHLLSDGPLSEIPVTDLYIDGDPHGTASLYYLAAAVTYVALFDEKPPVIALPATVHPLIAANSAGLMDQIWQLLAKPAGAAALAPPAEPQITAEPVFTALPANLPHPAPALGLTNPSLAMGLDGIADWSTQNPFIDAMKSARGWIGHLPGQWGGMDAKAMAEGGFLDEFGWLKSLPPVVTHVETLMLTEQPKASRSISGRYRLTYDGTGKITVSGSVRRVLAIPGEIWFDYAPGEGLVIVAIHATDPKATGDYIRNIKVIREDLIPFHEAGALFNPDWIKTISDIRSLRFMDWMFTNGSLQTDWDGRPKLTDYTYTHRGAPVELMLALANQIGADPWFNMPHMASDTYMRRFAEAVETDLAPDLKAYVEYSNELWNFIFPQTYWARKAAASRWPDQQGGDAWMQFAGLRAAEMAQIWAEVFADQAKSRLVRVVATHTDWPGLEEAILEAPLWIAEGAAHPPAYYFDAYAVTGYFGFSLGTDDDAPMVKTWLADNLKIAEAEADALGLHRLSKDKYVREHRFDQAVIKAEAYLHDTALPPLLNEAWPYQASLAARYGLDLVMYEGGTHVTGLGAWVEDQELTDFFNHLNYTPAMARVYQHLLAGWRKAGGTMFNAFVDIAGESRFGSWGTLRHLDDANPRHAALMAFNAQTKGWWETRAAGSFTQGGVFHGSDADDVLAGTVKPDILLAGAGADVLIASGAGDRLHGGAGADIAYLPGRRDQYRLSLDGPDGRVACAGPDGVIWLFSIEAVVFLNKPAQRVALSELMAQP